MTSPALEAACERYAAVLRDSFWDRLLNYCLGKGWHFSFLDLNGVLADTHAAALADRLHITRLEKAYKRCVEAREREADDAGMPAYDVDYNRSPSGRGQQILNWTASEPASGGGFEKFYGGLMELPDDGFESSVIVSRVWEQKDPGKLKFPVSAGPKTVCTPGSSELPNQKNPIRCDDDDIAVESYDPSPTWARPYHNGMSPGGSLSTRRIAWRPTWTKVTWKLPEFEQDRLPKASCGWESPSYEQSDDEFDFRTFFEFDNGKFS
jgi:hypothetical protein